MNICCGIHGYKVKTFKIKDYDPDYPEEDYKDR